jgi:hypothetical protein
MSLTTPSATRKPASFDRFQVLNGSPCSAGFDFAIFLISATLGQVKVRGRLPEYLGYSDADPSSLKLRRTVPHSVSAGERYLRDLRWRHAPRGQ